jgi:plasmid stability protein
MAQLLVRNVEQEIVRALRERAARAGRSAEAEHREILKQVLLPERSAQSLKELLLSIPDVGDDEDFLGHRDEDRGRTVEL